MIKISAVIICFNAESTIKDCLESVLWVDEVVVLDSFSEDETVSMINRLRTEHGNKIILKQQPFKGFSQQKQDAIELASNDWVLLLDADESMTDTAIKKIKHWQQKEPKAQGYALPRIEWVFWQWSHPWVKRNSFVRLFDKNHAKMSKDLVHESVQISGKKQSLYAPFRHFSETSIKVKLDKINRYSALSAQQKHQRGQRCSGLRLLLYPIFYLFRQYFIKRQVFNGIAGVINATLNSYYAYLKYAKLYELQRKKD